MTPEKLELARIRSRLAQEANWQGYLVITGCAIALLFVCGRAIGDSMKSPAQRVIEQQLEQIR